MGTTNIQETESRFGKLVKDVTDHQYCTRPVQFTNYDLGKFWFRVGINGDDIVYHFMPKKVSTPMPHGIDRTFEKIFSKKTEQLNRVLVDTVKAGEAQSVPIFVMRAMGFAANRAAIEHMGDGIVNETKAWFAARS